MRKRLEELLAQIFAVDVKEINDQTSPDNLSSWDSFNGLKLVEELEKNYKIKLDIEEVAKVKNVGDIRKMLALHCIKEF